MKKIKVLYPMLALSLILSSCASYNASPLCDLSRDPIESTANTEGVIISSKTFSKEDCRKFFDRDILKAGYQPIQLHIHNNSTSTYSFSPRCLSLPTTESEAVAQKVHTSTAGRVIGYGLGSLVLGPLIIAAIADGLMSSEANSKLDRDFATKTAKDSLLFPQTQINSIVFVPKDAYQDTFTLTLMNANSKEPITLQVVSQK